MPSSPRVNRFLFSLARSAISPLLVERRYLSMPSSYANTEHVAPISAPMLHIVALPVQLREDAPGPKYSTIEFVPPDTPSSPATFSMTSFGEVHPLDFPTSFTPINFWIHYLPRHSSHRLCCIYSTDSYCHHYQTRAVLE